MEKKPKHHEQSWDLVFEDHLIVVGVDVVDVDVGIEDERKVEIENQRIWIRCD